MARPLRIEYSGALYHVTYRGDRREPVYEENEDRLMFLRSLAEDGCRNARTEPRNPGQANAD